MTNKQNQTQTQTQHKSVDIVIVGSGIAGLYSAFLIKKCNPELSFVILEKYKKQWIGGRMNNEIFCGSEIVTGAGVGRKEKDILLVKLLKELNIPTKEFEVNPFYANTLTRVNIDKTMKYLKKEYPIYEKTHKNSSITFQTFAMSVLGKETYTHFLQNVGYTDYENQDAYETLHYYGMDDNVCCWKALSIPWKQLILTLAETIGLNCIKYSHNVTNVKKIKIQNDMNRFVVETEHGSNYECNKVIIATTIAGIQKLVPYASHKESIYQDIKGQPFLRLYGKFSKTSIPIIQEYVKGYTIVPGPIQKIIPIHPQNGIYMISYSDNNNALYMKKYLENTSDNRSYICSLIEEALGTKKGQLKLITIKSYYWSIGTHYYIPLRKKYANRKAFIKEAQNPDPYMLVVGEAISNTQGWTEGALESVEMALTKKWIQKE